MSMMMDLNEIKQYNVERDDSIFDKSLFHSGSVSMETSSQNSFGQ